MMIALWARILQAVSFVTSVATVPQDGQVRLADTFGGGQGTPSTPANFFQCEPINPNATNATLIGQLWRANCDIVERFLNNNFSVTAAQKYDNNTVDAFLYYSIQDYIYLLETIPQKAYLLQTYPPALEPTLVKNINDTVYAMLGDIDYAMQFRQNMTRNLGIDDRYITNATFHPAGLGYVSWLETNTNLGWYAYQVSRIACLYGWTELANTLLRSSSTNTTTLFYYNWIVPNSDWSYANSLLNELQAQVGTYNNSVTFPTFNTLFREGMAFEVSFFESALGHHPNDTLTVV